MKHLLLTTITLLIVSCVSSRPCQREELLPEEVALQYFLDTIVPQHDSIFGGNTIVTEGKIYPTSTYHPYLPVLEFYKRLGYYFDLNERKRQGLINADGEEFVVTATGKSKKFCPKKFGIKKVINLKDKKAVKNNLTELFLFSKQYEDTDEILINIDVLLEFYPQPTKYWVAGLVVKNNRVIFHNSIISIDSTYIQKK